jgi:hypothetical protein
MKYNVSVVGFLIVFAGFLGAISFWSGPTAVDATPAAAVGPQITALSDERPAARTPAATMESVTSKPLLASENVASWQDILGVLSVAATSGTSSGQSGTLGSTEPMPVMSSGPVMPSGSPSSGSSGSSSSGSLPGGSSGSTSSGGGTDAAVDTTPPADTTPPVDTTPPADTPTTGGGQPTGGGPVKPDYSLPEWITRDGIRAGFMSWTGGQLGKTTRFIEVMKSIGLNTAIVYGCSFAEAPIHLTYYREWLRLCNQAGLHVFVFYPWQPPVGNTCRPVVFADGTEGLFPCPLDNKLWQNYLTADMADKLAKLSVEGPQLSFDGYFLDMEMYRTENEPDAKRQYSFDTCFCDSCFSRFLIDRTKIGYLPPVSKDRRKSWLSQNGYLPDYYAYLTEQVEANAESLKNSVHAINPKLLFGVYPSILPTNWVLQSVMRAFGRNSYPTISFTTDTYGYYGNRANPSTWGAARIPSDLPAYFEKYNINGIYAAGYLFRAYTSSEIRDHLIKSCQRAQGYWLFRMPQLLEDAVPESEKLAGGSQADYLQAIKNANTILNAR